ncbi:MAG: hypothetical protein VYD54_07515 [Bdellovibrionota bacterium]|nr:hypothetical protein [Bdellovibrionota bacterium]
MNKLFICLLLMLTCSLTSAKVRKKVSTEKKYPIYHFILKLKPKMSKKLAWRYSRSFRRYSKRYGLDPFLLVSIAMQESGIILDKVRVVTGYIYMDEKYIPMEIETDFCMMQIHYKNVENMNLDLSKLQTNYDYCIATGAKILASFKRYRKKDKNWWSRYNARSPHKRRIYESLINRYYDQRP